jgi:hypothetical protein
VPTLYQIDPIAFERELVHCHMDIAFSTSGRTRFAIQFLFAICFYFKDELTCFKLDATRLDGIVSALRLNSDICVECVVITKINSKKPPTAFDPSTLQNE